MASRTKQKEEARARRLAEERAAAERQHRMRRIQMIGGIVVAAVAVVAVAIAISASGGSSGGLQQGKQATRTSTQVQQLLAGIPQHETVLGNANAPVTMVYYGDLECPVCRAFTLQGGFPQLVSNDVRSGQVKVEYRAFQTATRDQQTFNTQQTAALAAGKQNLFWNFVELFYREQGNEGTSYVTEKYLGGLVSQIPGLSVSAWKSARNDPALLSQVQNDARQAVTDGVSGTPTLIFTGPKGKTAATSPVPSYSDIQQAIKAVR